MTKYLITVKDTLELPCEERVAEVVEKKCDTKEEAETVIKQLLNEDIKIRDIAVYILAENQNEIKINLSF